MNSSHVCLACRRRLGQARTLKAFQWHRRATFISLSGNPQTTTDEKSRGDLLEIGKQGEAKKKRFVGLGALPDRRKRTARAASHLDAGDQLESLFEETLKMHTSPAKASPQPTTALGPYINADTLRKMLADNNCSVMDSWRFFVEHFGPEAWRKGSIDRRISPSYLNQTGRLLVKKIIDAKTKSPFSSGLPSVTEVSRVYSQLGMLRGSDWVDMMLTLLESLIKVDHSPSIDTAHRERLISDCVGAWNVVHRQVGKLHDYPAEGSSYDWSHIPTFSAERVVQANRIRGPQGPFELLVPTFPFRELKNMPVVAVATFTLLTTESIRIAQVVQGALPLISALSRVIGVGSFEVGHLFETHGRVPASIVELVKESWAKTKVLASEMHTVPVEKTKMRPASSPSWTDSSFIQKRLHDAMSKRDAPQVDKLWATVCQFPIYNESAKADIESSVSWSRPQSGILTAGLCNYFIMTYMALRQQHSAVDVWNHMIKNGLPPNLATWDAMLTGCKLSKDSKALEDVWGKMHHLRVQPDVVCWTTRISGLMECHKVDKAMQALDEMGRIWLTASKQKHGNLNMEDMGNVTDVSGAVKPTIETVNAAVAGLLRKHQPEAAHRVLAWAGKFGISPDVFTYNTLLRPLVRDGHSQAAMALLQQMQKDGIKADVATFTTILDETFRHSEDHTPEEQNEIIASIFAEMEVAGVKANLHTYGKIIYQLLQNTKVGTASVNVVMEHMARQGIQPTTYIYTILVNHYFTQQPPDLDAIRSLIERTRLDVGSVDHIFWDRVIEGYARVGDTASAVRILGKHRSTNNRPSWVTLQTLLTALVQSDEWDVARTLVRNAKADAGGQLSSPETTLSPAQQRFFRLAAELELLEG